MKQRGWQKTKIVGEDWPSGDTLGTLEIRWALWRYAGHFGDTLGTLEMRWAPWRCAGHLGDVLGTSCGTAWCIILKDLGHVSPKMRIFASYKQRTHDT